MTYIPTEPSTDFSFYPLSKTDATAAGGRPVTTGSLKNTYKLQVPKAGGGLQVVSFDIGAPCIAMYWTGMEP